MKNVIIYICLFILFTSCMDKIDIREISVKNNTNDKIFYSLSNSDLVLDIDSSMIFKDKINNLEIFKLDISHSFIDSLTPKENHTISNRPIDWRSYFDPYNKGEKLRLFIISKDSVDKYGWEGIYAKNIYNKKYTLDIDDLDSLNWTIEYNGN